MEKAAANQSESCVADAAQFNPQTPAGSRDTIRSTGGRIRRANNPTPCRPNVKRRGGKSVFVLSVWICVHLWLNWFLNLQSDRLRRELRPKGL